MLRAQQNRLAMFEAVYSYLKENESAFAETNEFVESMNMLRAKINGIFELEDKRSNISKGRTNLKNETRTAAVTAGTALAGAIFALAKKTKNITLADKSNKSFSGLDNMRDIELVLSLNSIKDLATENLEALSGFGVTSEKFLEYKEMFNEYFEALNARESSRAIKVSAARGVATLFKETEELLKSIDKLVEAYRVENKQFFNGYKPSRSIKDLGARRKKTPESSTNVIATPQS
jgi:hypothetical protein